MRDVAQIVGVDISSLSRTVDRLVGRGLARREPDPNNRRAMRLTSTNEGRTHLRSTRAEGLERLRTAASALTEDQLGSIVEALTTLNVEVLKGRGLISTRSPSASDPSGRRVTGPSSSGRADADERTR